MRVDLTVMVRVDHAGHHHAVLHVQHQIRCLAVRGKVRRDAHPVDHVAFHIPGGIADFAQVSIVRRQQLDVFQRGWCLLGSAEPCQPRPITPHPLSSGPWREQKQREGVCDGTARPLLRPTPDQLLEILCLVGHQLT